MLKAHEVMTHALATCAPDASVAHVAAIMRDRDIGNVLVVEDNKLRGIVTDRDLVLQALRKQMAKSELYHAAQHAMSAARDKVDEAASSKSVRNLRRDVGAKLTDLAAQLPTLEYKPARAKHG